MTNSSSPPFHIAVIGGGPAGLMAAQAAADQGAQVELFDAMPSVGRKFLLAGRGGMNITHAEGYQAFVSRYARQANRLKPALDQFGPQKVRDWVHGLGVETFVGSSNRVFPTDMKAAPLLRAWLHRLREAGVQFHMRYRWTGWQEGQLAFATPDGERRFTFDAVILALGGGSWARLGSDGAWVPLLQEQGVAVAALAPANCGFDVDWSAHFSSRYAGEHLATLAIKAHDIDGLTVKRQGQCVITAGGVEGGLIYALSAALREQIARDGSTTIWLDLAPDHSHARVFEEVTRPRGARSMSSHLQSRLGLKGVKSGLLRECLSAADFADEARLARAIKLLPVTLQRPRPIDEAISSAGGVAFDGIDGSMLRAMPGVFVAGEMLDWEAPTGGYLLTACLAQGKAAGEQAVAWLEEKVNAES
ncbi:TIGR03862 family flavoprotein [Janthinobacterium sp. RB2P8]|uniref:TIGR03862 family flavoprotein n=1 Tax=Janthinobacterium sp. RB2P8 TaxID=3424191 RepID=UPI003F1F60F8